MLLHLVKKELQHQLYSNKFIISFTVSFVLIILTFYVGARNHQLNRAKYEASVQENIRGMEGITDWRMINHKIFLPPQPLESLVNGIANDIGRNINMEGLGELKAMDSRYNEDPLYAAFRFLDLNFIFQIILSLFAVLLMYDSINGEKELGTLRLTFANSISRHKYILSKIISSFLAMTIPVLIPLLIGVVLFQSLGAVMSAGEWLKLTLIIISGIIYFTVFLSLSIFVSASTERSANSFLILIITWIVSVIIIPPASVLLSGKSVNVPSVDDINAKKSAYARQMSSETFSKLNEFKPDESKDMMSQFNEYMDKINTQRDNEIRKFNGQLNEERRNAQFQRELTTLNIARFSPASSFYLAVSSLAGTSMALEKSYYDQAIQYQKSFADFQREKEGMTTGGGMMFVVRTIGEEEKEIDPGELPVFDYKPVSISDALNAALPDIGILLLYTLIFFALAYLKFLKFDLR